MPVIEFNNVGKMYRLGRVGTGFLQDDIYRWWQTKILHRVDPFLGIAQINDRSEASESEYVWALKEITLSIDEGEVVGIIGKNGSGKSTLLKLLSSITSPTTGTIKYEGRISSLLEVGTGFHSELTGRENIYMNGAILGMKKREISSKLDEIVAFSGVERYLDTPVKRYSSGMIVRLGFSVAAFLDPEILVVDEVLTVGDAEFQRKAMSKMESMSHQEGRTVLFVSHNLEAVKALCRRGIVLDKGQLVYDGSVHDAVSFYRNEGIHDHIDTIVQGVKWSVSFLKVENIVLNGSTHPKSTIQCNQKSLDLLLEGTTKEPISAIDVRLEFRNPEGIIMASLAEGHYRHLTHSYSPGFFSIKKTIQLPRYLSTGDYIIDIVLHNPNVCLYMQALSCARIHIEGSRDPLGDSLECKRDGFAGLISTDSDTL